ncbi:MAG: NAD(+)/NADH kinase [Fimbriimonadaceae bacterium]|mgnify:CR=1 FL=1
MQINLLVNTHRADAVEAARRTVRLLQERSIEIGADIDSAPHLDVPALSPAKLADADLLISFGGDGTLIRAASICSEKGTPILGVYYGRFGFVTQCLSDEMGVCLSQFLDGQATIDERMMLQTELVRGGDVVATLHSLNETVLQRDVTARMMTFNVSVDCHSLTSYPADGVLVATPTGSTGYNLSAGGPIVDPRLKAMILTAIAPHTLTSRPLILSDNSMIKLGVQAEGDAVLSSDGQIRLHLLSGDEVRIRRSDRITRLLSVDSGDFMIKLSERLLWSRSRS